MKRKPANKPFKQVKITIEAPDSIDVRAMALGIAARCFDAEINFSIQSKEIEPDWTKYDVLIIAKEPTE
jgi:hypothetical protein